MKIKFWTFRIGVLIPLLVSCAQRQTGEDNGDYAGSKTCIQCHQKFYDLWSTSHHGKAMQPVNALFMQGEKLPPSEKFQIEGKWYNVITADSTMTMIETDNEKVVEFPVIWVLGGKNVYYFLTPLEKGKLQTIPLAYDLNIKSWYNNPQSALRHFPEGPSDQALPWRDRSYNFNTSCYSCHVSQLETNFDLDSDSYKTLWKEPGINCETCHGSASEHIRIFKKAKEGDQVKELGLISTKKFTKDQHNSSCAPCHAKMRPLTAGYIPGDRFFDNYDLTILNNLDFYPDGRDLGENYTYTGWLMNKCNAKSELHCVNCHTSSGRDKFKNNPNDACKSCHSGNVENVEKHSQHKAGTSGAICINCHMPKTEFGKMIRSDHSFRPPMPEATIKFGSPNSCNICHKDKTPQWANSIVKKRTNSNYQDETIRWGTLLSNARMGKWDRLDAMTEIIEKQEHNEVVIASFVRTLENCNNENKMPVLFDALKSKSPLVRSSAASALSGSFSTETGKALLEACSDEFRVVRIAAAASLAEFPKNLLSVADSLPLVNATREFIRSLNVRSDDWSSHYNIGIYYQGQGDNAKALESYETAVRIYPEALLPLINSSVLYSALGNQAKAIENLRKAMAIDSVNEAANLNYGLVMAEQGEMEEAEKALKIALKTNPKQAVAAYNLSVITSNNDLNEAIGYARIATKSLPGEPKYGYTLAYYLLQNRQNVEAIKTLRDVISRQPLFLDAYKLLADTYMRDGKPDEAVKVYRMALETKGINENDKIALQQIVNSLNKSN